MDGKSTCTDVVRDASQPATVVAFVIVFRAANFGGSLDDWE